MKYRKTYGAPGLMEWDAEFVRGSVRLKVHFDNGVQTGYGDAPAEYTTEHPLDQILIEGSPYFASGRVVLLRSIPIETDPAPEAAVTSDSTPSEISASSEDAPIEAASEAPSSPSSAVKHFDSLNDARDYFVRELGIAASRVRTRAQMEQVAAEEGLSLSF